jgi:hypothetical protein
MRRNDDLMTREAVDTRIARYAARRYGVFSRTDAQRLGATTNIVHARVARGRWERLLPGVYRIAGAPPSWRQGLLAACLGAGGVVAASHVGSAGLWHLEGFPPGALEISVERGRRVRQQGVVVHQVAELPAVDVTVVDAIPTTSPARTLLDLAAVAPEEAVEEALDDALRRGLTSLRRIEWRAAQLGRRPGLPAIRRLIVARRPGGGAPQSLLETRLLRLIDRAELPRPVCQHKVKSGGRLVAVVDFAYPEQRIAIEADGYRWHSSRSRWQHDLHRGNELVRLRWRVLHVTADDILRRSQNVAQMIAAALQRR